MRTLSIVAFMDGRLGHEKQTQGVLEALSSRTAIKTEYIHLPVPSPASDIRNVLLYAGTLIGRPQRSVGREPIDLIIGTGSRTHIPMVFYKKENGGRVVTCMTPDIFIRNRIDLCLVPLHDPVKRAQNMFFTVGPPSTVKNVKHHQDSRGLILVGGLDKKSHVWDSGRIMATIEDIVQREPKIDWTVSSSPRTPQQMLHVLDRFAAEHERVRFFRSQDTPAGWIERAYAQNHWVWVTADSISMVYEALAAGCQVGIVPVQWKKVHNKFQRSIDYLVAERRAVTYAGWLQSEKPAPGACLDEAGRCADEILRRWWPDRL